MEEFRDQIIKGLGGQERELQVDPFNTVMEVKRIEAMNSCLSGREKQTKFFENADLKSWYVAVLSTYCCIIKASSNVWIF